jgi:thioesterase domain-containing protein
MVVDALVHSAKAVTCYVYHTLNRTLPPQLQTFYIDKIVQPRLYGEAGRRYQLKPYPGRVIFFKPDQGPDRSAAWHAFTQEGVEIHRIPGDHSTMIAEPGIMVLADRLRTCLEKARHDRNPVITNIELASESRVSV